MFFAVFFGRVRGEGAVVCIIVGVVGFVRGLVRIYWVINPGGIVSWELGN